MTNLLIGYPDIPQSATRWIMANGFSGTANQNEDYPMINTMRGERYQFAKSNSNATNHYLEYDLGPTSTKSVDFVIISRLDTVVAADSAATITLYGGSTTAPSNSVHAVGAVGSATLRGPWSNDYVGTLSTSTAYRYWQLAIACSGSRALVLGKVYFGTFLNLSTDWNDYKLDRIMPNAGNVESGAGTQRLYQTSLPRYELRVRWRGVTQTNTESFFTNIYQKRHTTTFFLYTSSYHDILDSTRLLHVRCLSAKTDNRDGKNNYNNIEAVFQEVHG